MTAEEVKQAVESACRQAGAAGRRVLALVPDSTRTCPLGLIARAVHSAVAHEAKRLDFLIALGTHPPMNPQAVERLFGCPAGGLEKALPGSRIFNHRWNDQSQLAKIGSLDAGEISRITGGMFELAVDVTVNKLVFDYDLLLIVGPVFPHEVVGFSGGSKYIFPAICGPEMLNFFHWLGAVITSPRIIGNKSTPVRETIEAAADLLNIDKSAICLVVDGDDVAGVFGGDVRSAWSRAADLSARLHIKRLPRPFESVLARAPKMYDDLWTGGKCMYKLEPVVADGGELIIYAPHIREISRTWGRQIEQAKHWGKLLGVDVVSGNEIAVALGPRP